MCGAHERVRVGSTYHFIPAAVALHPLRSAIISPAKRMVAPREVGEEARRRQSYSTPPFRPLLLAKTRSKRLSVLRRLVLTVPRHCLRVTGYPTVLWVAGKQTDVRVEGGLQ